MVPLVTRLLDPGSWLPNTWPGDLEAPLELTSSWLHPLLTSLLLAQGSLDEGSGRPGASIHPFLHSVHLLSPCSGLSTMIRGPCLLVHDNQYVLRTSARMQSSTS